MEPMSANLVDDRGPQVAAVAGLFLGLAWLTVSLRCYVRAMMNKSFGLDDWLAGVTLVLFTLYCVSVLMGVAHGTGRHLSDIDSGDLQLALQWWWTCELFYISSTTVLKVSIGVFLLRICVKVYQKVVIWTVMGVVTLFSTAYLVMVVVQCRPISYFWTQFTGGEGYCVPSIVITDFTYAHSVISAWADWTLGILPIFLVWNLNMNLRTKISVALILALGAIGSAATVVRIPFISQLNQTQDFLYATTDVAIWSTVEPGMGLAASAIACLRPLVRTYLSRSRHTGTSNNIAPSWGPSRARYFRNHGNNDIDELGLRNDVAQGAGVTTTIKGPASDDSDLEMMAHSVPRRSKESETKLNSSTRGGWGNKSLDSSTEDLRSDPKWADGIVKTMEVRTHGERKS